MSIMPNQQRTGDNLLDTTHCPEWCLVHCPGDDDAILHLSDDFLVEVDGHGERSEVHLSIEQLSRPETGLEKPAIRIQGAADAPMAPGSALELAAQITYLAHRAMFR
uniref:DUF6907 domain-containing protein n=1 Tax=Paractinoplanes polyasparticus TaxID=2856853 RepID=UPI001C84BECE|nr:hypothetical protein [Actinoplanes polyasparticus]